MENRFPNSNGFIEYHGRANDTAKPPPSTPMAENGQKSPKIGIFLRIGKNFCCAGKKMWDTVKYVGKDAERDV